MTELLAEGADQPRRDGGAWIPRATAVGRRRSSTPAERAATWVVAAVVAVLAVVTSDASPTGITVVDALERALAAGLVTLAGPWARRWSLITGSGIVAAAAVGPAQVAGLAALGLVVALVFTNRRQRVASAVVAGLVGLVSLHLDVGWFLGAETLLALAATVPVLVSAHRYLPSRSRRRVRTVLIAGLGISALFAVLAAVAGVTSVRSVDAAVDATRSGVTAAQEADGAAAAEAFGRAAEEFGSARGRVGAWWASGARLLPVVGPNLGAAQDAVRLGADLTSSAEVIAADVDFDRVRSPEGGIDLAVLAEFERPVLDAASVLERAGSVLGRLDSPWIVDPLADQLAALRDEVADLDRQTEVAALGVADGPALLGADGPRRYLFLLGNPAELRDLGGHVGNWAEVVVDEGRFSLGDVGGPLELSIAAGEEPEWLSSELGPSWDPVKPALFPQNWGADPDMPTVARTAGRLFAEATGRQVDGVVYADTAAFAAFLELTGPVLVPGLSAPLELDAENAEPFLTREQFVRFPDEGRSSTALESVIEAVFERLTSIQLPGPRSLAERFGPLVRRGSFQVASLHDEDTELLERFGVLGAVPDPDGGDLVSVLQRNANPSKIDSYLRRRTTVDIDWDPATGDASSVVTVELFNDAPAGGSLPLLHGNAAGAPVGSNVTDLAVLTPFQLDHVRREGSRVPAQPLDVGGLWRHTVRVTVPPGGHVTTEFHLRGQVDRGSSYRLGFLGQPILGENQLVVSVRPSDGPPRTSTRELDLRTGEDGVREVVVDADIDHVFSWHVG